VQASHKVSAVSDDPNLIGSAGLGPGDAAGGTGWPARAARAASERGVAERGPQSGRGPRGDAGADSIDDLDALRHGGRLVIRRVARLNPAATAGQDELFTSWRHHGFVTNSTLTTVAADETHRDDAIVEQVIAELKDGPLAHAPSGRFQANGAWLALAGIAFNLFRAAGAAAGARHAKAR